MEEISVSKELVAHHSDEELIRYLNKTTRKLRGDAMAVKNGSDPNQLIADIEFIAIISSILSEMVKRYDDKKAIAQPQ